jgi:hypothetical protein
MKSKHVREPIGRPTILAFGVKRGHLLPQPLSRDQFVHLYQIDLAAGLALFVLALTSKKVI